jgi:hypothetical protein
VALAHDNCAKEGPPVYTRTCVIHSAVYWFGNVQYALVANKIERGIVGSCRCGACGGAGESSVKDDNVEMAMLSAQASLIGHHRSAHQGEGLPPPTAA